jgi:hypothetical protein
MRFIILILSPEKQNHSLYLTQREKYNNPGSLQIAKQPTANNRGYFAICIVIEMFWLKNWGIAFIMGNGI